MGGAAVGVIVRGMEIDPEPRSAFWFKGRFSPREVDILVTIAVAAGAVLALVPKAAPAHLTAGWLLGSVVAIVLGAVPLLWRRTHPGPMLVAQGLAFALGVGIGLDPAAGIGLVFGVYACALYGRRRVRIAAGITAAGVLVAAFAALLAESRLDGGHLAVVTFGYGLAWVVGDRTRTHRAYLAALRERARRLESERDEQAKRAAEDERVRIARELHDVVAHNVSVIAVQAGAARATAGTDPRRAMETLSLIERTARSTLGELRSVLGLLRKGERPLRDPRPSLDQLETLTGQARAAEIQITTSVEGTPRPLPEIVDLCAFRLIQEALTNVIRHAPRAHAHVLVRYGDRSLRIVVADDGPGPSAQGGGSGLIGMRERVGLLGGELHTGAPPGGGFRVDALLPIDSVDPEEPDAVPAMVSPA
jgi:signal transduction histidine kinase